VIDGPDIDRRFVLRMLAALVPAMACTARVTVSSVPPSPALPSMGSSSAIVELGRLYLQQHPEEHDRERLVAHLGIGDAQEPEAARIARINDTIARDLDAGDLVDIAGWQLARTECRVYALAALG
jgi:hypothetical protein